MNRSLNIKTTFCIYLFKDIVHFKRICNFFPNSQEFTFSIAPKMNLYKKDLQTYYFLKILRKHRILLVPFLLLILLLDMSQLINISEYIYFRF